MKAKLIGHACACLIAAHALTAAAGTPAPDGVFRVDSCIALDHVPPPLAPTAQPPRQPPGPADAPPTERELDLLIRALEPVALKTGGDRAIRAVAEGTELRPDRLAIVLGDAAALLAGLHAREILPLVSSMGLDRDARTTFERQLRDIQVCGRKRFDLRGGGEAFSRTSRLVIKYRDRLESVLLVDWTKKPASGR